MQEQVVQATKLFGGFGWPRLELSGMDVPNSADESFTQQSARLIQRVWRGRYARSELLATDALWRLTNVITAAGDANDSDKPSKRLAITRMMSRQLSQRDSISGLSPGQRNSMGGSRFPAGAQDLRSGKSSWTRVAVARRFPSRKGKPPSQSSISQNNGDLGVARGIDDLLFAPLVYRLVALNTSKAWGTGKMVQLAEKPNSDEELAEELSALLLRLWKDDPIRVHVFKEQQIDNLDSKNADPGEQNTWADVLLEGRGTVGETVLHLVFLLNTPACRRLIRFLVPFLAHKRTTDVFGHKVIDHQPTYPAPHAPTPSTSNINLGHKVCALDATYLGQPYFGEVAAHFAIVHEDLPMLKLLVSHGASLTSRACGDFFYSNPLLYFGGTLLGFAACLDNKPMVEYLLTNEFTRANPNGRDQGPESSRGHMRRRDVDVDVDAPEHSVLQAHMHRDNAILHCLVLHERAHMYRYLVEHGANAYSPNSSNQTPMLLAVAKGSRRMVSTAIEATQARVSTYTFSYLITYCHLLTLTYTYLHLLTYLLTYLLTDTPLDVWSGEVRRGSAVRG